MTTADYAKPSKRGFFSVYKPGQGKYVRWGTVAGLAIFILTGAYWIGHTVLATQPVQVQATAVMIWVAIGAIIAFLAVNTPKLAEFMIMTESEMRKVTWPSRREVITATKIVIIMTLLLAGMLWVVDFGFATLFQWMRIL